MSEIEVGEYIRTKRGYIRKVIKRDSDKHILVDIGFEGFNYLTNIEEKEDIVKHSHNIIDLAEAGDIIYIKDALNEDIVCIWSQEYLEALKEDVKNGIKLVSILTKEQFTQNCYKVKE